MRHQPDRARPVLRRLVLRRLSQPLLVLAVLVLLAGPAAAENPVFDAEGDADVTSSLAEAQQAQGVCYGYLLEVSDPTGQFSGTYASSSAGAGQSASAAPGADCPNGVVELQARIDYASDFSEASDYAAWQLFSSIDSLTIRDVERLTGSNASVLLDDAQSETALLNAVLALPGLVGERTDLPKVMLAPNTDALPADARPTDTPGSDWLRQNGALLFLCVASVAGGAVALVVARRPTRSPADPPRTFGPPRGAPDDPTATATSPSRPGLDRPPTSPWSAS